MPRYVIKLQYDGTRYVGYQVQPNGPSIQGALETALLKITKQKSDQKIATSCSGRTDSGVHALGQVVHFDLELDLPPVAILNALNALLDKDIRVVAANKVSDQFHARYQVLGKGYRYRIDTGKVLNPFKRFYTTHHPYSYSLTSIQKALEPLLGWHDFTSFCSTKTDKEDKRRTLYKAEVREDKEEQELIFDFYGNGFLYNMIRIIVGTAMQIGDGLKDPSEMQRLLQVKDRNQAGPTAPPQGLYLMHVDYRQDPFEGGAFSED